MLSTSLVSNVTWVVTPLARSMTKPFLETPPVGCPTYAIFVPSGDHPGEPDQINLADPLEVICRTFVPSRFATKTCALPSAPP